MKETIDVHEIFASYFPDIKQWAYLVSEALEKGSICIETKNYHDLNVDDLKESSYVSSKPWD